MQQILPPPTPIRASIPTPGCKFRNFPKRGDITIQQNIPRGKDDYAPPHVGAENLLQSSFSPGIIDYIVDCPGGEVLLYRQLSGGQNYYIAKLIGDILLWGIRRSTTVLQHYVCVPHFYDLSALVGCWSSVSIRRIIYKFLNVCPFDCTGCCGQWEG